MKSLTCLSLVVLATSACTSSTNSGGTGGGGTTAVAIDDLASTYLNTLCTAFVGCPPSANGISVGTVEGCKAVFTAEGMGDLSKMINAVKSNKIKYDGASAQACITAMATCNGFSQAVEPTACTATFTGTIADGGSCAQNEECISAYCLTTNGCGTCTARAAENAACDSSDRGCVDGLACLNHVCTKAVAKALGNSCSYWLDCPDSAFCGVAPGASKLTCLPRLDVGATCSENTDCKAGLFCPLDTTTGKCTAVGKTGDPCVANKNMFDPAAVCESTAVCVTGTDGKGFCKPYLKAGGACGDSLECFGVDLACVSGKCAIVGSKDAACAPSTSVFKSAVCLPNLMCSGGKCTDLPAAGQPCVDNKCAQNASCNNGTCKGPPGSGEACYGTCADGFYCATGTSGPGTCTAISCNSGT